MRIVTFVPVITLMVGCTAQKFEPKPSQAIASVGDTSTTEVLVIGRISAKAKMDHWKESFRPVSFIGGPPDSGEFLIVVQCGDNPNKPQYCVTSTK